MPGCWNGTQLYSLANSITAFVNSGIRVKAPIRTLLSSLFGWSNNHSNAL